MSAVDSCWCPDVVEDLHHHSPMLMREIEAEQEKLPDMTIRLGEGISGLDQAIDLLLEQILQEQEKVRIVPFKVSELSPVMTAYVKEKIADTNNLRVTKDSRKSKATIKFASPAGQYNADLKDLKPFFKKYGFDIDETDEQPSGQYNNYVLTARRDFTKEKDGYEFPKGTQIIYMPTVIKQKEGQKQSYILNKALTPGDKGLDIAEPGGGTPDRGKAFGKQELMKKTAVAVKNKISSEEAPGVADQLIQLLKDADNSGNAIPLNKDLDFSDKDFATISKDYGEILSGIWSMNEQSADFLPFSAVKYPPAGNFALVDFFGVSSDPEEPNMPISVKSGGGGAATISNIIEAAKLVEALLPPQNNDFAQVAATNEFNNRKQVIELNKILKLDPTNPDSERGMPGIRAMGKVLGVNWEDVTYEMIDDWTKKTSVEDQMGNKHPNAKELGLTKPGLLQPVWDAAGSMPKLDAQLKRTSTPDGFKKYSHFIAVSPLGQVIEDNLNQDAAIKEEFNRLARALTVVQCDINVKKRLLTFKVSKFSEASFKFAWPGLLGGNKMGFRMEFKQ